MQTVIRTYPTPVRYNTYPDLLQNVRLCIKERLESGYV